MPETPAVVKHAGSTYPIALPDVAECGAVSSWVRTLHERVAAVTGVPAASQRLLCKAWKGRLHESIFKSVDKCAKKIAKQSSKAAKLGSPIALMVFDEERSHDVKVALGHATPLQLFEEDVRAAVRRTSERDDAAARRANITPSGGPYHELGGLRLKTWSKFDLSVAETTPPANLYIYLY